MIRFLISATAILILLNPLYSAQKEQLADVLTIGFVNETGKPQYDWLGKNIPAAVIDSMKEKFQFNLAGEERISKSLAESKKLKAVNFKALLTEKDAAVICTETKSDILIFGKYSLNEADKTITVNAFIFHRSRAKITGKIDMVMPVSNEMFKLVDQVADSAIEHIEGIAREDALKTAVKIEPEKKGEKIALVKREGPVLDSYYVNVGLSYVMPAGLFWNGLSMIGMGISGGIQNSYASFYHYGASMALIGSIGDTSTYGIIDLMFFMPVTGNFGINYKINEEYYIQPFIGIGGSLEFMSTGEEKIFLNGTPLREENKDSFYIDPCLTVGIRMPIMKWGYIIVPFVQAYQYVGKITDKDYDTGILILYGVELSL